MDNVSDKSIPVLLGTAGIGSLLLRFSLPAIVGMTASSIYNMIDSIFIGQGVGAYAISGMALTFPVMMLAAALGSLVGIGAATLISVRLGEGNRKAATEVLGNVVLLNCIIGVSFTLLTLPFLDHILIFFGASEQTLPYARDFMQVILLGNVITHLYLGLNDVMRSSGYPFKAMFATLTAVAVNVVLGALFIFVFNWGIRGAAFATILAQLCALSLELLHLSKRTSFVHFNRSIFKLKRHIVGGIISVGLSPFAINACSCLIIILININMKRYGGDLAIGAYGIVNRVVFLFIMIVIGLNQGMQPIVGYNLGAHKLDRVRQALKYTIFAATGVTMFGFICCQLFPHHISSFFTKNEQLIDMAAHGIRIVVLSFPVVGFQIVASSFFQSIRKAKKAIFLSLTRQMLFLVPLLLILPAHYKIDGVWISLPLADSVATVVAAIMLANQLKKFRLSAHKNNLVETEH